MKLHELLSEKINTDVTFKYREDIEGDKNRGFQVDEIKAYLNDEEAGYVRIIYIPKERFEARYPNILAFLNNMEGKVGIFPYNYRDVVDYHKIPPEGLKKNIENAYIAIVGGWDTNEFERLRQLSLDQVIPEYEKFERIANKRYGKRFKEFKNYYVDKGIEDFIRVHPHFQNKGVGAALEYAAHKWMKNRGMKFYFSNTRTDPGKGLLKKIKQEYPIATDKMRSYGQNVTRDRFVD